jgi:hypothetical protein
LKSLLSQYAGGQCHVAIRYRNAEANAISAFRKAAA